MKDKRRRTLISVLCIAMCVISLTGYFYTSNEQLLGSDYAKKVILANHIKETGAVNAVTSIYLNYRLWDTLFEALVLLLSAVAVISFSWSKADKE